MKQKVNSESIKKYEEVIKFRNSLNDETDRGCALMSASYIDVQLNILLQTTFVDNPKIYQRISNPFGPLGSFSARIDLAYLIGKIGKKVHDDLHLIRKIRNEFGHSSKPLTFTNNSISDRCRGLYNIATDSKHPKNLFTNAVMNIASIIQGTTMHSNHAKTLMELEFGTKEINDVKKLSRQFKELKTVTEKARWMRDTIEKKK